jgi:hypothetical protein
MKYGAKTISEPRSTRVIDLPTPHITLKSRSSSLIGRCAPQLRESCPRGNTVYSRAEHMYILERYLKSFAAVPQAFSNSYPDDEVPNNRTRYQLVTTRGIVANCSYNALGRH